MTSREFLDTVRKIVCKADWQKLVRVGGDVDEQGDLMLRREADGTVSFVSNPGMICPLEDVQHILYKIRREDDDAYDTEWYGDLRIVFEIKGNNTFTYDIGQMDTEETLDMDGTETSYYPKIKELVAARNQRMARRRNLQYLIASVASIVQSGEEISANEMDILHKEIENYMSEDPDDLQDFLLFYGYKALEMVTECGKDVFDVNTVLEKLISKGWKTEFIDYVREQSSNPEDLSKNRTYVKLSTTLLGLLQEHADSGEGASAKE